MRKILERETAELKQALRDLKPFHGQVLNVFQELREAFNRDHIVYVAGNGGSATQAQHFSSELLGRYKSNRPSYACVALTADQATLTCIGNDFGFEEIFSRQLAALGLEGDVFMALSTSGNSANILRAVEVAKARGMVVIGLTGRQGKLREMADHVIESPADTTARIQELHLHAIHLICELLEPHVD